MVLLIEALLGEMFLIEALLHRNSFEKTLLAETLFRFKVSAQEIKGEEYAFTVFRIEYRIHRPAG